VRALPHLCGFYPGICLKTEEKARLPQRILNSSKEYYQVKALCIKLYRGADKSLARPGRKQATSISKSSWMMDPTRSREMSICSALDIAEIRRSSKISSWIWSIISGVVRLRTYQHPRYKFLTLIQISFLKGNFLFCLSAFYISWRRNGRNGGVFMASNWET
jgi:hypothetical protein